MPLTDSCGIFNQISSGHEEESLATPISLLPSKSLDQFQNLMLKPGIQKLYEVTTPEDILANHSETLSCFEMNEITNYSSIYYYGENAFYKHEYFDCDGYYNYSIFDHILYRYEIWRVIGKGAFCTVIEAYDHKDKEFVAVKIICNKPFLYYNSDKEIEMLKYVLKINELNCEKNFVQMRECFRFRDFTFIIFEKLSTNFYELLIKRNFKGFGPNLTKSFTYSLVESVYILHKHHVVHCDLKPENMLLHEDNGISLKVIDFGLSCFFSEIGSKSAIQTLYYSAPETILMGQITPAVDMWSIGCIVAEFFTGKTFLKGENSFDQLTLMVELLGVPPSKFLYTCTPEIVKQFIYPNFMPKYCSYVEDGFGGVTVVPSRSPNGNIRGIPGSRNLRKALQETTDNDLIDFITRCLDWNPVTRLTAAAALQHPYLRKKHLHSPAIKKLEYPTLTSSSSRKRYSEPWSDGRQENNKRFYTGTF